MPLIPPNRLRPLAESHKQEVFTFLFFAAILVITFACYSMGFSATFFFDDEPNLAPLGRIQTLGDIYDFIFNGSAGPLGRPISLASFLINYGAWPSEPAAFFYSNTLIHLINACLLFWFFTLLLNQIRLEVPVKPWVSALAASLWVLQPMHLAASMFVVQRMTLISATFVLLGLIAYLKTRDLPITNKYRLPLMLVSLGSFSILAGLSKENGFLLPGYVLVLEYTLLAQEHNANKNWANRLYPAILWLLPIIAIAFVSIYWNGFLAGYGNRPFTIEQRLFSETIILWDYVRLTFLPARSGLNPFRGNEFLALNFDVKVLFAISAWTAAILLAIYKRRKWPWFGFGVFWFMVSHSMESSVIPLELYFHHRNYLPSIGLLLGSVIAISQCKPKYRQWAYCTSVLIMAGFGFVLYQSAIVWGNVPLAAALWYEEQPRSERAIQFQARALGARSDWEGAYQLISHASQEQPLSSSFKLQQLQAACGIRKDSQLQQNFQIAIHDLDKSYKSPAATDALDRTRQMVDNNECSLTLDQLLELNNALMKNPSFQNDVNLRFEVLMIRARIYKSLRHLDPMMAAMEAAYVIRPTLNLGTIMAYELATAGLFDESEKKLDELENHLPNNLLLRQNWISEIARAREGIEAMRKMTNLSSNA